LPVVALDECHEGATLPAALEWVRNVHHKRQEERAATAIALGAKDAGVDPTELVARLDASPEK
jgi:hypothetical protein